MCVFFCEILTVTVGLIFIDNGGERKVLKEYYEKEVNRQIDIVRGIDSVCFSIGANNKEDFARIAHNVDLFKEKSIEIYNRIISSITRKMPGKLYFLVCEEKESEFTAIERRLGIRHKFKNIPVFEKAQDIYLSNNIRYNYMELSGLNVGWSPHCNMAFCCF